MDKIPEAIDDIFTKIILENIKEEQIEKARKELPFLKKNIEDMQQSRGAALESAIMVEHVYLHTLVTFTSLSSERVLSLSFGQKTNEIVKLIEIYLEESEERIKLINRLKEIKELRNLYAHVPIDYLSSQLKFNQQTEYYESEFLKKMIGKSVIDINREFMERAKGIEEEIFKIVERIISRKGLIK